MKERKKEKTNSLIRHFLPTVQVLSTKNAFLEIKNSIFRQNSRDTEEMLRDKIVYFEEVIKFANFFLNKNKYKIKIEREARVI